MFQLTLQDMGIQGKDHWLAWHLIREITKLMIQPHHNHLLVQQPLNHIQLLLSQKNLH